MQNSPTHHAELTVDCLRCGRSFQTEEIELFGRRFAADRYCDFCQQTEAAEADEQRIQLNWSQVQIPAAYRDCSFENFEPVEHTVHALTVARNWAREFRAGTALKRGLLFHGPPGAGKTHLGVAILRATVWSEPPARCLFLNVPEWLNALRDSRQNLEHDDLPNPYGYKIVLLDDLGAEHWSDWARERIYSLVNHREQGNLLTLVTTNCSPGELASRVGRATDSRLHRLCLEVLVDARRDYREIKNEREGVERAVGL
jgi:DNA replication protein DnaC